VKSWVEFFNFKIKYTSSNLIRIISLSLHNITKTPEMLNEKAA